MAEFLNNSKLAVPIIILSIIFVLLDIFYMQLTRFNMWIRHIVNKTREVKIKRFMIFTHQYNDIIPASTQIVLVAMILGLIWKDWKSGLFIMASLAIQTSVVTITKRIAVRARPPHLTAHKLMTSGSYPSGHSASTMTMALLVPAMLMPYLPFWAVILVVVYFLTNAIVTAYGRLYLDMHWATDIIGGWVLSVITFFVVIYLMGIS